tara:strand:+ start:1692 stop:1907 length:216 start_codon:yes stop_codon:yes gene_type:complete
MKKKNENKETNFKIEFKNKSYKTYHENFSPNIWRISKANLSKKNFIREGILVYFIAITPTLILLILLVINL